MARDYAVVLSARMSSERLPGKALVTLDFGESVPNIVGLVERWLWSERAPVVIVATSDQPEDDAIAETIEGTFDFDIEQGDVRLYRGSRDNVLARMDGALKACAPDARYVARALADNPLVDVDLADWRLDVLRDLEAEGVHYGGREAELTYAATTDVWSRSGWDRIVEHSSGSQLEHPGAWYWENLGKFKAAHLTMPRAEYVTRLRTELDTPDDLAMFRAVWRKLGTEPDTLEALQWLERHPEVARLNADVPLKTMTHAVWGEGSEWQCPSCSRRIGGVVNGDLVLRCKCGARKKFYSRPPAKLGPALGRRS